MLPVWGGLYLEGLYLEGLIFGNLRYVFRDLNIIRVADAVKRKMIHSESTLRYREKNCSERIGDR